MPISHCKYIWGEVVKEDWGGKGGDRGRLYNARRKKSNWPRRGNASLLLSSGNPCLWSSLSMKFRKVLGKAFRGSWDIGEGGQMPLAQLAEPSLCIAHPNSPAGWFQLGCRPKTGTWKQAPGSQECSHWLFRMLWEKYFCQVRTVTQEHTSQIALYRFWLNVCWMASTLTQSSSSIIYK